MQDNTNHVPNQILAMLKAGLQEADVKTTVANAGGTVIKTTSNGKLTAILINVENVDKAMEILQKSGQFEAIQLNYLSHPSS